MMDDGLLSQEDIDALTAGLLGGGDDDDGFSGSDGGGMDPEFLRPLVKMLAEQSSSVVSAVLSKNVDFKILNIELSEANTVDQNSLVDSLAVRVEFSNDLKGDLHFLVSQHTTAILADVMMMGDGTAPYEEEHKDALSELFNQVMGSVNTAMTEQFRTTLKMGQSQISDLDANFNFDDVGGVVAKIDLKIEEIEDSMVYFVLDQNLCESFIAFTNREAEDTSASDEISSSDLSSSAAPQSSEVEEFDLPQLNEQGPASSGGGMFESSGNRVLDMLLDIPLNITIELGRTQMSIRRILEMGPGSIIELDRFSGEPVDLLVNNKVVARGEVVVVDENFGIRIVSLVTPEERIKFLK